MVTFNDFSLREELTSAVSEMGFENPTPIQEKVIPHLLSQPKDIIALAQTGTGKTAAFGLPLLHNIDVAQNHVQALVLSPTRELCMQIESEFQKYGNNMRGLRTTAVYGGVPISGQIRSVKRGAHVIVATPGRLMDLMNRNVISLENMRYLILDEADEMLNMGFREDIETILQSTPEREFTWLFSATMSNDVRRIAKRFMNDWDEYAVAAANTTNENIDHQYYITNHHNRFETLKRLLDYTPGIYGIIFTRTKSDAQDVSEKLMRQGYHVSPLHGDMDQNMRSKVMGRFKNKTLQAIVATDVAARGIDVNDITHVINYELPDDPEVYTHRSGRTARAGKSGICMSIVSPKQISNIRGIERLVKSKFTKSSIPDGAEVVRKKLAYHLDQIETAEPTEDFADTYLSSFQELFDSMEKDELIKKLIWLQLQETMNAYHDAKDLNAGFGDNGRGRPNDGTVRLFMNMGEKDGISSNKKLLDFVTGATDIEQNLIQRVTVRELSSFFNVPSTAAEFIIGALSQMKHKGRKVRIEEAEQRDRNRGGGGGFRGNRGGGGGRGYRGGDGGGRRGDGGGRGYRSGSGSSQRPDNKNGRRESKPRRSDKRY